MDKEVYSILSEHARDQGISINSLLNSIAKRHLTWERFAGDIGFIPITKRTLKKIFRELEDEKISTIAVDVGGVVPRELAFFTYGKMDFENLIKILEINGTRFGSVRHITNNNHHSLIIHHGIGEKFSKFLAETHKVLADELSFKITVTNLDMNMICFDIEDPKKIS